jgi:hypothetical protein
MRRDHESAPDQRNENFDFVRWQAIAPIGASKDARQASDHDEQNTQGTVTPVPFHECECSKRCDDDRERPVSPFL